MRDLEFSESRFAEKRGKLAKMPTDEWLDLNWEHAKGVVEEVYEMAKQYKVKRLKIGRPYDIEIEFFGK